MAGLWCANWTRAADAPEWKAASTFTLPGPAGAVFISADQRLVYVETNKKGRRPNGLGSGFAIVDVPVLLAFEVKTGKARLDEGVNNSAGPRFAVSDKFVALNINDHLHIYDTQAFRKVADINCQTPNDNPGGAAVNGVPNGFEGISGLISDFAFSGDSKTVVVARKDTKWKQLKPNVFQGDSCEQFTFWDAEKGKRLGSVDCEDRGARFTHLTLLPRGKRMLVAFNNGACLLDVDGRKWGSVFAVKNDVAPLRGPLLQVSGVVSAAATPDEKHVAIIDRDEVRIYDAGSGKETRSFPVKSERALGQSLLHRRRQVPAHRARRRQDGALLRPRDRRSDEKAGVGSGQRPVGRRRLARSFLGSPHRRDRSRPQRHCAALSGSAANSPSQRSNGLVAPLRCGPQPATVADQLYIIVHDSAATVLVLLAPDGAADGSRG